jgi:hypothetical protein
VVAAIGRVQEPVAGCDPQVDLNLAAVVALLDLEPCVCEHLEHRRVVDHHLGHERLDALPRGGLRELFDEPRPHSQALQLGRHRKRRLGSARIAQPGVACRWDDLISAFAPQQADQGAANGPVGIQQPSTA